MTSENTPKADRKAIEQAIVEMLDELTDCEALELEDFMVNHCDDTSFIDDEGNYPNLFRMFGIVTGCQSDCV